MSAPLRRAARGQGTVEFAVSLVAIVTTAMLGIYLSEATFLSMKVQEASAYAVFESASRRIFQIEQPRLDNPGQINDPLGDLVTGADTVVAETRERYRDFDSLTLNDPAGAGLAQVYARGQGLQVQCNQTNNLGYSQDPFSFAIPATPSSVQDHPASLNARLRDWYQDRGGFACTASAQITNTAVLPQGFGEGNFGAQTNFRNAGLANPIRVCGVGRAAGANCNGRYGILLGDWSLDGKDWGAEENMDFPIPGRPGPEPATNGTYRQMVRMLWEESGQHPMYQAGNTGFTGASYRFAAVLGGDPPMDGAPARENRFAFSYAGAEHRYRDSKYSNVEECNMCHFNTAGTSTVNGPWGMEDRPAGQLDQDRNWDRLRKSCFLGLAGCDAPN